MGSDSFTTIGKYLERDREESRPGFRWGVLGVVLFFVAGAFSLGFTASSTISRAEADRLRLQVQKLQDDQEKLRREFTVSTKKATFRTLSWRIKKTNNALAQSPKDKDLQRQKREDEQALASFIQENIDKDPDTNGVPVMRIIKRETVVQSSVKFDGDDTLYPVPPEVKRLTPVGTFYQQETERLEKLTFTPPFNTCPGVPRGRSVNIKITKQ